MSEKEEVDYSVFRTDEYHKTVLEELGLLRAKALSKSDAVRKGKRKQALVDYCDEIKNLEILLRDKPKKWKTNSRRSYVKLCDSRIKQAAFPSRDKSIPVKEVNNTLTKTDNLIMSYL